MNTKTLLSTYVAKKCAHSSKNTFVSVYYNNFMADLIH